MFICGAAHKLACSHQYTAAHQAQPPSLQTKPAPALLHPAGCSYATVMRDERSLCPASTGRFGHEALIRKLGKRSLKNRPERAEQYQQIANDQNRRTSGSDGSTAESPNLARSACLLARSASPIRAQASFFLQTQLRKTHQSQKAEDILSRFSLKFLLQWTC